MKQKKIVIIAMLGLFGMVAIGCSKAPDVPKWAMSERVGYFTGTGIAKANKSDDLAFQTREAMDKARVALAAKLKSAVRARSTNNQVKKADGTIEGNIEQLAEIISKKGLENAKTLNSQFMDDGRLFVQIGVKEDIITGNAK